MPFASSLAAEEERGRVVGRVMSGLLLGILLARTVAGLVAELGGWRLIYGARGGRDADPRARPAARAAGRRAAGGRARLRRAAALGRHADPRGADAAAADGVRLRCRWCRFSGFWTSIAFLLSGPEYGYSEAVIGLFSLAGLAGAGMAAFAGRVADAGHQLAGTRLGRRGVLGELGPAGARRALARGAAGGHRAARPRRPGDADPQPERDLPAAPRGAQPAQHGLHDVRYSGGACRRRRAAPARARPGGSGAGCARAVEREASGMPGERWRWRGAPERAAAAHRRARRAAWRSLGDLRTLPRRRRAAAPTSGCRPRAGESASARRDRGESASQAASEGTVSPSDRTARRLGAGAGVRRRPAARRRLASRRRNAARGDGRPVRGRASSLSFDGRGAADFAQICSRRPVGLTPARDRASATPQRRRRTASSRRPGRVRPGRRGPTGSRSTTATASSGARTRPAPRSRRAQFR